MDNGTTTSLKRGCIGGSVVSTVVVSRQEVFYHFHYRGLSPTIQRRADRFISDTEVVLALVSLDAVTDRRTCSGVECIDTLDNRRTDGATATLDKDTRVTELTGHSGDAHAQ